MAEPAAAPGAQDDPLALMRSRRFLPILVLAALVGIAASLAAWSFLELVHWTQVWVYTDLPKAFGYHHAPRWWSLPILAIAGAIVAFAIVRLPGNGGHIPADGLNAGVPEPIELPGVMLAALATIGLGIVLGPEAPLIALGGGLAVLSLRMIRRDAPAELTSLLAACGAFAAMSLIFDSPLVAALLLVEASGVGGPRLPLLLVPGLLGAGIGSLVSIGMGSFTGLSTSAYSLATLTLPAYDRPTAVAFGWTIALAIAIALGAFVIFRLAHRTRKAVIPRPFVFLPVVGLAVGGLAIAFAEATDKGVNQVLFSGQDALPGLVSHAGSWSLGALALLVLFKGLAWSVSLGSFRGGPTFPAMFLGAAAGLMASHLPGFDITPGVAVGIGAGVASVLRLPLSAVVLAALLTAQAGAGSGPLVIVGVVVAYLVTNKISPPPAAESPSPAAAGPAP